MTNAQRIFEKEIELALENKIPTLERRITVAVNGEERVINEPTHIYSLPQWRNRGYLVREGEKAIARINLYRPVNTRPAEDAEPGEDGSIPASRMELKPTYFFSADQVEPIPEIPAEEAPVAA